MSRETTTTTASPGSATPVAPFNDDDKIEAFAEIIKARFEVSSKEPVALLKRIATNTDALRKLKPGIVTATA